MHDFRFPHCYIFFHSLVSFHYGEPCGWIPIELIQEYVIEAQRAQGVIDACLKLRESQHVPESVWRKIYKKSVTGAGDCSEPRGFDTQTR